MKHLFRKSARLALAGAALAVLSSNLWADAFSEFLSGNSIRAVVYDFNRKLVWFGSWENGLLGFDGNTFQDYTPPSDKINAVPRIQALALDHEHSKNLWIGTESHGVLCFNPDKKEWRVYDTTNGLNQNKVKSLAVDDHGRLWVGTADNGVGFFDGNNWFRYDTTRHLRWNGSGWDTLTTYQVSSKKRLTNNRVHAIAVDKNGNLWFGTDDGVSALKVRDVADTTYTDWDTTYTIEQTLAIFVDDQNNKWCGTSRRGVHRIDKNGSRLLLSPCVQNAINAITADREGNLWFGLDNGAATLDPNKMIWRCRAGSSLLDDKKVRSLAKAEDGVIWLGADNEDGAVKHLSNWLNFSTRNNDALEVLESDRISAIVQDRQQIWISTQGGVARYQDGVWHDRRYFGGSSRDDFPAMALAGDGTLWLGSFGGGIIHIKPDGSEIARFVIGTRDLENYVRALAIEGDTLWVGTEGGLARFNLKNNLVETRYTTTNSLLPHNRILALEVDFNGVLWAGTPFGVCRLNGTWTCFTSANTGGALGVNAIHAISVDEPNRRIWFGTSGGGATYYDDREGTWNKITTAEGLVDNNVQDIQFSPKRKETWFATGGGLSLWDSSGQWTTYLSADGLPENNVTRLLVDDEADNLWIGTQAAGITRFHRLQKPPDTFISTPLDVTTQPEVVFRFFGVDQNTSTLQLRYKHRLDSGDWQYTSETFARVRLEKTGKHTFFVKAIDKDNNEDPEAASDSFFKVAQDTGSTTAFTDSTGFRGVAPVTISLFWPPRTLSENAKIIVQAVPGDSLAAKNSLFAYDLKFEDHAGPGLAKTATLTFTFPLADSLRGKKLAIYRERPDFIRLGGDPVPHGNDIQLAAPIQTLGRYSVRNETSVNIFAQQQETAKVEIQPRTFSPMGNGHSREANLSFFLEKEAHVVIRVYNLGGRLVHTIWEGQMGRGVQSVAWNGYDQRQRLCPTGLYIMTIASSALHARKTVMVLNQ